MSHEAVSKTTEEISAEIEALKAIKPNVPETSEFGDNHRTAIDAQIKAIENRWHWVEINEHIIQENDHFHALQASDWWQGVNETAPSKDWATLTTK